MGIRIAYDIRGAQASDYPERGIAQWVTAHALALIRASGVDEIVLLGDQEAPLPPVLNEAFPRGITSPHDAFRAADAARPMIHHIGSPFASGVSAYDLTAHAWPRTTTVRSVTLYDCIPIAAPQWFEPGVLRAWRHRSAIVRFADVVLAISRHAAADGQRLLGLANRRLEVIGCAPPDRQSGDESTALPEGIRAPYVLYAGGLGDPRKNVPALVRAFGMLAERSRDTQLVLAGRANAATVADLMAAARVAGVAERLVMPGLVSDSALARLYAGAACVAYPSLYEGFGLPIAEAMQFGAPVICSATTACGEVAPHRGATFDPTDDEDIARAMGRVLGNPAWADRLRALGAERAAQFTWDEVARRSVQRWTSLVEDSREPPRSRRGLRPGATVICDAVPQVAGPGGAALLLARTLATSRPVDLLAPVAEGAAGSAVRHRKPPGASGRIAIRRPGPLLWVIDSRAALRRALTGLAAGGVAIVWEPDLLGADARALQQLARVADVVVTRPGLEPMLDGGTIVGIAPPLRDPMAAGTAGGIAPPLEEALLLSRRARFAHEPARGLHLVVRPPRFGPIGTTDVATASELAESRSALEHDTRVVVLGDTHDEHTHAHPAVRMVRWPRHLELLAWITAAASIRASGGGSLGEVAGDLAALGGARLHDAEVPSLAGRDADTTARALLNLVT